MQRASGVMVVFALAMALLMGFSSVGGAAARLSSRASVGHIPDASFVPPANPSDSTASVQIELIEPQNYAIVPPGTSVQFSTTGTSYDAVQYSFDGGWLETPCYSDWIGSTQFSYLCDPPWAEGMHVLQVDALSAGAVVASRSFVFFTDSAATLPLDTMSVNVVLIGFDESPPDVQWRLYSYWSAWSQLTADPASEQDFPMRFDFTVQSADPAYAATLLAAGREVATYRSDLQARLNLAALTEQRDTGTPMDIFDPLVGYELPSSWLEAYVGANPPVSGLSNADYTFYVVNFGGLDDAAAGIDHWFVRPTVDPDSGRVQDWWRLEWDNALNTPMGFPMNIFGGPDHRVFIDPTAYEWYLDWTNIWWYRNDGRASYGYQYEEIPVPDRAQYLADDVNYLIEGLVTELPWAPPAEHRIEIRNYVLDGSSTVSASDLTWVVHDEPLLSYLSGFLPMKEWNIQTTIEPLADVPGLSSVVDSYTTYRNGHGYIDGDGMWTYLYDHKADFVADAPDTYEILTVSFVFDDRSMVSGGYEYTGLGGDGITAIFLQTHRLFTPEGQPQKGLTDTIAHETGHNLGYGHQFGWYYYADFVDGSMGYFRDELSYGTFWEDALYRVYIREKQLALLDLLAHREPMDLWSELKTFVQDYQDLHFLAAYNDLVSIERLVMQVSPPITTIISTVNGNGIPLAEGHATVSHGATFQFTSTKLDRVAGFECTLDGVSAPCTSPQTYAGLSAGPHSFEVYGYDADGHYSTPVPSFQWTVLTPAEATGAVIDLVVTLSLSTGVTKSLLDPLQVAYRLLTNTKSSDDMKACRQLDEFIVQVSLYESKGRVFPDLSAQLRTDAWEIEVALLCP